MTSPFLSYWISGSIHVVILLAGFLLWRTEAQFGVQTGRSSTEVHLVAAAPTELTSEPMPQEEAESVPPAPEPVPPDLDSELVTPTVPKPSVAQLERPSPNPQKIAVPKPRPTRVSASTTSERGDGSSPTPGKDRTSFSSDGGAIVNIQPDYLRNPPAVYPSASREAGQEGLVVLQVILDREGRPETVSIRDSSGYPLLDESAVKAVRNWRFQPATMGGIKMRSRAIVPVRFRLNA